MKPLFFGHSYQKTDLLIDFPGSAFQISLPTNARLPHDAC